jgi:plastocyanin
MVEYAFEPKDLTVSRGATITFTNDGQLPTTTPWRGMNRRMRSFLPAFATWPGN